MIRKLLVMAVLLFPFVQSAQCFTVKGKAVTEDGKTPAAGIVVQATHMRDAVPGRKDDFVRTSTTGAGGLFSLDLPSFNDMYIVCLLDGK